MSINIVTDRLFRQLRVTTKEKPIVLLYPWSSYRNVFLAHFLQTADSGLIYLRPVGTCLTLDDWLTSLVDYLDDTFEGFSKNLRSALETHDPVQMGEALAADLAVYSSGRPIILFIDEFDRVVFDEDLKLLLKTSVANLTQGVQLVFNSRCFRLDTWSELQNQGEVCVLGTEDRPNDVVFTIEDKIRPQLEVYAFGQGHVLVNGQEITQWDGALPRNLFFYLMDHPLTTRDEIFEVFWPKLAVKEATNVFHVTKRKISERISEKVADAESYELTQYKDGFYIAGDKVMRHYDVSEFQEAIEQAMLVMSDEKEIALLTRAIALYKQAFLTTISMDWSVDRRNQLRLQYAQALNNMARLHQRNHDWQAALGYFVQALRQTPEREDIHREVMNIYRQQGMYEDAIRQYRVLERIVNETLHIVPDHETTTLYETIQAQL